MNLNVFNSGTEGLKRWCAFRLSAPDQFIFNPLVLEFFIVMVSASSDVMLLCVGSAFFVFSWLHRGTFFYSFRLFLCFPSSFIHHTKIFLFLIRCGLRLPRISSFENPRLSIYHLTTRLSNGI